MDFSDWHMQFRAIAIVKKFSEASDESFKEKLPTRPDERLNANVADEKKKMGALVMNNVAISYVTIAFLGDKELCMIKEIKTEELPGIIAYKLTLLLLDEYGPYPGSVPFQKFACLLVIC